MPKNTMPNQKNIDYELKFLRQQLESAKANYAYYKERDGDIDGYYLDKLNEAEKAFFAHLQEKKKAKKLLAV